MRIPNIIFSVGTAALLLTASAGIAFAKDEGRFQTTEIVAVDGSGYYVVIDTKTGRTSLCFFRQKSNFVDVNPIPKCALWAESGN